jgi:hypothetical protein
MKAEFKEYYAPNGVDYEALIKKGLIVFDANVLLDLYRLPRSTSDALLRTIGKIKHRVWIPYNVGLEYQRNRIETITQSRKRLDDLHTKGKRYLAEIEREVVGLEFDKRGMREEAEELVRAVRAAGGQLEALSTQAKQDQVGAGLSDPLRDKLDDLFLGRIGTKPLDQSWLDSLYLEGEQRFAAKVPPGFSDAKKTAVSNEGGLVYKLQYGDLLLWRQLLIHVKSVGATHVVLVTNDSKPDWWTEVDGKTVGPHPHLIEEMLREGGADSFWIYNLGQFIEQARAHIDVAIPEKVVTDVKNAENSPLDEWKALSSRVQESFWREEDRNTLMAVSAPYLKAGWALETISTDPLAAIAVDHEGRKVYLSIERVRGQTGRGALWGKLNEALESGSDSGVDFVDVVLVARTTDSVRMLRDRLVDDRDLQEDVRMLGIRSVKLGLLHPDGEFRVYWSHLANFDHPPP